MKNRIIISKNGTIITPYKKHQCRALENFTSIKDEVYYDRKEITGFRIDKYDGQSAFITHNQSREFLSQNFEDYEIEKMKQVKPKKIMNTINLQNDIVLRENQEDIIVEINKTKDQYSEWFINLPTGYGKTLMAIYLSAMFKEKTLIACYSTDILSQWLASYKSKTDINPDRICQLNSTIITSFLIEPKKCDDYDIYLTTPGLLTSYCKNRDYNCMQKMFSVMGIGLLIFDESHRNTSNIVKINALSNIHRTLYLSADYGQGDYKKEPLYYRIFKNTLILKPKVEVRESMKYTKGIVVEYNSNPSSIESMQIYSKYGFSPEFYMRYQFSKGIIFKVVDYIMAAIMKNSDHHRTLILTTNIAHVDILAQYIEDHYKGKFTMGRYHSKVNPDEKEFAKDHAEVIVATYKSFSTGLDTTDIKYVVSLNQSNKIEDNQAAGRARQLADGSDAVYFMVVDTGFKYCRKKLKTRLRYLADVKMKALYKIKLDDDKLNI